MDSRIARGFGLGIVATIAMSILMIIFAEVEDIYKGLPVHAH